MSIAAGVITCTAWELCGEFNELIDNTHEVRIKGGRTTYQLAENTRNNLVRLERLATDEGLRIVRRYVRPDTAVELVPIQKR